MTHVGGAWFADLVTQLQPLEQGGITVWAEPMPTHCPEGHELTGNVHVGSERCSCTPGRSWHRTHTCGSCGAVHRWPECVDPSKRSEPMRGPGR